MISSGLYYDSSLPLAHAIVEDGDLYLHPDTWAYLSVLGCLEQVWDYLDDLGAGEWAIPVGLMRPHLPADSDLAHNLAVAEPGARGCTIPGCLQGEVRVQDTDYGRFPLCARHRVDFRSWDEVIDTLGQ